MKKELRSNVKLHVVFLSIITMYAITLVAMYDPSPSVRSVADNG